MPETTDSIPYNDWLESCLVENWGAAKPDSKSFDENRMREIPASYIRRAVEDSHKGPSEIRSGLRLTSYRIVGPLQLQNLVVPFPIYFENCFFDDVLLVWRMESKTFSLNGSKLAKGIDIRTSKIDGHLLMRNGFCSVGPVLARDLEVTGTVDLDGASLLYRGNEIDELKEAAAGECFSFSRSKANVLYWRKLNQKPESIVSFRDAKVDAFNHSIGKDDWEESWPHNGQLILDGFRYRKFTSCGATEALRWLRLQSNIAASSYAAVARAFQAEHSHQKVEEILAEAKKQEIQSIQNAFRRLTNKLVFFLVGYGRTPTRAVWVFFCVFLVHFSIVHLTHQANGFEPRTNSFLLEPCFLDKFSDKCTRNDKIDWREVTLSVGREKRYLPPAYPDFNPSEFALESFFPIFDFKQNQFWQPSSFGLRVLFAMTAAFGFFVGGVFVGGITGLISPKVKED